MDNAIYVTYQDGEKPYLWWLHVKTALVEYRALKRKYEGAKLIIYVLAAATIVLIVDGLLR